MLPDSGERYVSTPFFAPVARTARPQSAPSVAMPAPLRSDGMLGLGTLSRVLGEVRRDVAAAHARDPAARGVRQRARS